MTYMSENISVYIDAKQLVKITYLRYFSLQCEILPGSGMQVSLIIILAPGFKAGISAFKIKAQYLSDQLWKTQRMK